jgi:membrane protein YdbS with pleckstrin-like domain
MAYPRDQLHQTEELILDLHPHWWFMARSIFALALALIFAIAMLAVSAPDPIKILSAILLLVALGWFLVRFCKWATTDFVLTSDRVIFREGVVAKKGIEIPLERINTIFFQQRILERVLGLGNLEIESASKDGAQVFEAIRKPSAVQNQIYQQMEVNSNRRFDRVSQGINDHLGAQAQPQPQPQPQAPPQPQPQAAPAAANIPEQIEQLSRLRDQGMISPEEFEAKKTELLNRM